MTWTTPKTWASGDVLTSADQNTYVRDNTRWLGHGSTGGAPMCRVTHSVTQTIGSSGNPAHFDTETFDLGPMHDTVTNNDQVGIPSASGGKYLIGAATRLAIAWTSGNGQATLQLKKNSTTLIALQGLSESFDATDYVALSVLHACTAGDYFQTCVGWLIYDSIDVAAASDYSPQFWAIWMGV